MTARTSPKKSRPARTHETTRKEQPDLDRLWEISTQWHSCVRGMLEGIMDSATGIEQVVEDSDHPLANIFNHADFPDFTKSLQQAICSFITIIPPAVCPVEIPDPLSIC